MHYQGLRAGKTASEKRVVLLLLKYLWVLALLPKAAQFIALFLGVFAVLFYRRRDVANYKIPGPALCFFGMALVQLFSIMAQCALANVETERLLAAFNTMSVWIIGALFYLYATDGDWTPAEARKLVKYAVVNIFILFAIYIFSLTRSENVISLGGYQLILRRRDFLESGATTRFNGLMETVLGPSHLYCILAPLIVLYGQTDKKRLPVAFFAIIVGYYVVVETHSRIGLIVATGICAISLAYLLARVDSISEPVKAALLLGLGACFLFAIVGADTIANYLDGVLNSRQGSNSARFAIYRESLTAVFAQSPLIGIGIKYDMPNGFPYGSHCTYIGVLYKTGLLGFVLFLVALYGVFTGICRTLKGCGWAKTFLLVPILYLAFLVFADIDGTDWGICLAFSVWGLLSNPSFFRSLLEAPGDVKQGTGSSDNEAR